MADEPDGIDEAFEGGLRVGLTVAGRVAEVAARAREQAARDAAAVSEQHARELRVRLNAERAAARAALAPLRREEWWASARPEQVAAGWETARAWSGVDPDAAQAADRIRREVRDRYGVDVDDARPEPGALAEALASREADLEALRRGQQRRDQVDAQLLIAGAGAGEPAGASPRRVAYDSPARREDLARELAGLVDPDVAAARVLADTSQAAPAVQAVRAAPGRVSRAHPSRGASGRTAAVERTLSR